MELIHDIWKAVLSVSMFKIAPDDEWFALAIAIVSFGVMMIGLFIFIAYALRHLIGFFIDINAVRKGRASEKIVQMKKRSRRKRRIK